MNSLVLRLAIVGMVVLSGPTRAGEKLVYAVTHKGSDFRAVQTDVFAVDPTASEGRLVFTDKGAGIILLERPYVFHFPVTGGGKVFAHAAVRGKSIPFPGNGSLYELSTDGSNSSRRIVTVVGDESLGEIFANPSGTRVGYVNRLKKKQYIFIHDVATGELIHQTDVTDIFLDCYASSIGWLNGRGRLFFSIEAGDVHVTSEESYDRVGSYEMMENGESLAKLKPLPSHEGYWPPRSVRLIGALASGEYLYETTQQRRGVPSGENKILVDILKVSADSMHVGSIGFGRETKLYSGIQVNYRLSPSGRYLAAAALPISSTSESCDIWLKDLPTGLETKLLSIPTKGLEGPFVGLVGWVH